MRGIGLPLPDIAWEQSGVKREAIGSMFLLALVALAGAAQAGDKKDEGCKFEKKAASPWGAAKADKAPAVPQKVEVSRIDTVTEQTDGEAVHGEFAARVIIANKSKASLGGVKVTVSLVVSNHTYPQQAPTVVTQYKAIDELGPEALKVVTFAGFKPDHPELVHELVVNVSCPPNKSGVIGGVGKAVVPVVFPPGARD